MTETNFELKAKLLSMSGEGGVRRLAKKLRIGPAMVISVRREMLDEGLVDVHTRPLHGPGRPEEEMRVTALGREFLKAHGALQRAVLRSRRNDLRRAASDGRYAGRLAVEGLSTIRLFLELDWLARHTRETAR